jgi:hypothetical protein
VSRGAVGDAWKESQEEGEVERNEASVLAASFLLATRSSLHGKEKYKQREEIYPPPYYRRAR